MFLSTNSFQMIYVFEGWKQKLKYEMDFTKLDHWDQ